MFVFVFFFSFSNLMCASSILEYVFWCLRLSLSLFLFNLSVNQPFNENFIHGKCDAMLEPV